MSVESALRRVDINPTLKCNLDCIHCVAPHHQDFKEMPTSEWFGIIDWLRKRGNEEIVFTGGEPLLRRDIDSLLTYAKIRGARVTLSTNCILLPRHLSVIGTSVDDIGIPIDGSDGQKNMLLRKGGYNQFQAAIDAISLVRKIKPSIEITVRTVASKINLSNISDIAKLLNEMPEGLVDRWKIYQCLPPSGEKLLNWDLLRTSNELFVRTITEVKKLYPNLNIEEQDAGAQFENGGYVFIWPDGVMENIYAGRLGNPLQLSSKDKWKLDLLGQFFP